MKEKFSIRYNGFRSEVGGRIFDFAINVPDFAHLSISVEIPTELFAGVNRIQLQEGVGIAYAKLKNLFEIRLPAEIPQHLYLTAYDLAEFRNFPVEPKRRSQPQPKPELRRRSGTKKILRGSKKTSPELKRRNLAFQLAQ